MSSAGLFAPMLCLMLITIAVWIWMFARRLSFSAANNISPEQLKTPEEVKRLMPEKAQAAGNNLSNLFELPVIFYALTLVVAVTATGDDWFMRGAWAFVGLRALHSVVHCTYNKVMHRFMAYALSSLILWALVIKVALQLSMF